MSLRKKIWPCALTRVRLLLTNCPAGNKMSVFKCLIPCLLECLLHCSGLCSQRQAAFVSFPSLELASGCSVGLTGAFYFKTFVFY